MDPDTRGLDDDGSDRALLARVEELREAVRARDEFIAIAAHELRNPMTPILMQVEALRAAAQRHGGLGRIAAGLERLEALVEAYLRRATTLLDVSRITSGKLQLVPVPVDLSALLRRVAGTLAPAADRAECRLELDIEEGVRGVWDPLAIEQVIENLLSNAIKFGSGKPIGVLLRNEEGAARVVVRDRGPGIAASERARLFMRFEQTMTGREQGGFGVGLWLVGQIVAAMGGAIEVESEPGEGAAFTVLLPRHHGATTTGDG
jgi:signal transduction histidine kinase